jgi:cytochrome P450 / NADPH-cytochrome P450 reductase
VGNSILFYGCRNAENDFLYADELKAFEASGITQLKMAFSREPGEPRTFVQQVMERERDQVWDLITAGAVIYVCGNANTMAPGVRAALMDTYRAKTNGSASTAEEWLAGLREDDRYLEDIWGEMASGL